MRPVEFAPDVIVQAGLDLQAVGRNITGFALRQKVGGGNPTRLKQVWDEHLAKASVTKSEPVAELPMEVAEEVATVTKALTERLSLLAVELNDKAVKAAERRVHEIVRSAGEQRQQAERELSDASQTVEDLETQLELAKTEHAALQERLDSVQKSNQEQAIELAQLRERLTLTEKNLTESHEQHAREIARIEASNQVEHRRLLDETHRAQSELTSTKRAYDAVTKELSTVKAMADVGEREMSRLREHLQKAEDEKLHANLVGTQAREDVAKQRGQIEAMQTQVSELMRALASRLMAAPVVDTPLQDVDGK